MSSTETMRSRMRHPAVIVLEALILGIEVTIREGVYKLIDGQLHQPVTVQVPGKPDLHEWRPTWDMPVEWLILAAPDLSDAELVTLCANITLNKLANERAERRAASRPRADQD